MHTVTILVPTFNEEENVMQLVERLQFSLSGWSTRLLFIDDSTDSGTVHAAEAAAQLFDSEVFQVAIHHRSKDTAWGGLAGAITDGLRMVTTPYALVMDADLQHRPEDVPTILSKLLGGYDLVIGSRYCPGGSSEGLSSPARHFVSRSSTSVAKAMFRRSLAGVTDPMTGFFALRMESINPDQLQPLGFKILLEILVSHRLRVAEVPIVFAERHGGSSKASFDKGVDYLHQLARLRYKAASLRNDTVGSGLRTGEKDGLDHATPQEA